MKRCIINLFFILVIIHSTLLEFFHVICHISESPVAVVLH